MRDIFIASLLIPLAGLTPAGAQDRVGQSPWGPEDELGRLNLMTTQSRSMRKTRRT